MRRLTTLSRPLLSVTTKPASAPDRNERFSPPYIKRYETPDGKLAVSSVKAAYKILLRLARERDLFVAPRAQSLFLEEVRYQMRLFAADTDPVAVQYNLLTLVAVIDVLRLPVNQLPQPKVTIHETQLPPTKPRIKFSDTPIDDLRRLSPDGM